MSNSDYGLGAMTGVLPTLAVAGAATQMAKGLFPATQTPSIGTAWSSDDQWQIISKKETFDLIGAKKIKMLTKNPGKVFTWGYDKFKFESGKYYLA